MKVLRALWRLLDRRQQRQLIALQLLSILMAFSTVSGIAAVLPFLTVLADPHTVSQHQALQFLYDRLYFGSERYFVIALGVTFAAVVVLSSVMNLCGLLAMNRFAFQVGNAFHADLFAEYLQRSYAFHSQTNSATLASNVIYDTGRVTAGILRSALMLVASAITAMCIAISMLLLNPLVALFAVLGLGAAYALIYSLARARLLQNGLTESRDFAARTQVVNEGFGAIKEVLILQAQEVFVAKFVRYCRSISRTVVSTLTIAQSPRYVLESATVCALVGVALYLSVHEEGAGSWVAQLSFIGFAAYRLLPALQEAFAAVVRIRADVPAFERIAADLQRARVRRSAGVVADPANAADSRAVADVSHGHTGTVCHHASAVLCRGVSFSHAPNRAAAISDLNMLIPAGAVVGLMGANGSGKSTLLDLVAGLLVPQSGSVEVDGVALDDRARRAWQASLAYVPQNVFLLDATLAENIAFGLPAERIDRERVRAVVKLVRLDEYVASLPGGYDELVGERGARLSGGQRQKLGIARALYRDAATLIMDEATSALDVVAEQEIVDMLAAQRQGRTMLIVAHRLSALRHCDVLYELAAGRVINSGTPHQLLPQICDERLVLPERLLRAAPPPFQS